VVWPCVRETVAGEIVTSAGTELVRVTTTPPAGAAVPRVKLPESVLPIPTSGLVTVRVMAEPTILKGLLVADVRPVLAAVRVYPVPALLMLRPVNVATPLTAAAVSVPDNVPLAGFVPIAKVTEAVEVVTVFPPASSTVTCTWLMVAPALVFVGCVVKASLVAGPAVTLKDALVAAVRPVLAAPKV